MHQKRKADFRTGIRYGKDDHAIRLEKPDRPKWVSKEEYERYPDFMMVREIRIRIQQKGFLTKEIIIHTSFEDDVEYSKEDIGLLFRRRWQAELNLRSIKTVMQVEHCCCDSDRCSERSLSKAARSVSLARLPAVENASVHWPASNWL